MHRRTIALALVGLLAVTASVALAPTPAGAAACPGAVAQLYPDVPHDHPFCAEIYGASVDGWVSGQADGSFAPQAPVTRAQMAAILWQAANIDSTPAGPKPCEAAPFPDVPVSHVFCPYIRDVAAAEVMLGYGDGSFGPALPVTRQVLAATMYRYPELGIPLAGCPPTPFADVPVTNPFCPEIKTMALFGVVVGGADGLFHPADVVTRQVLVAVTSRALVELPV